jgi:hypothetical protein
MVDKKRHCPKEFTKSTIAALSRASFDMFVCGIFEATYFTPNLCVLLLCRCGSGAMTPSGAMQALPLFNDRKSKKSQARSTLAEKLASWLESDAATEWREQRKALWAADDEEADSAGVERNACLV